MGCDVTVFSTNRKARGRKGVPDVYAMHPRIGGFWWESKAPKGKRSFEQQVFGENCVMCRVPYGWGGEAEAKQFLKDRGML